MSPASEVGSKVERYLFLSKNLLSNYKKSSSYRFREPAWSVEYPATSNLRIHQSHVIFRIQRRTMSTAEVNQFLVDLRNTIRTLEQIDIPTIAGTVP